MGGQVWWLQIHSSPRDWQTWVITNGTLTLLADIYLQILFILSFVSENQLNIILSLFCHKKVSLSASAERVGYKKNHSFSSFSCYKGEPFHCLFIFNHNWVTIIRTFLLISHFGWRDVELLSLQSWPHFRLNIHRLELYFTTNLLVGLHLKRKQQAS